MKVLIVVVGSFLLANSVCAQQVTQSTEPLTIVGGVYADENAYPWVVELVNDLNFHFCGASLIAPNWVVTAGHCADGITKVRLNPHSSSNPQASTEVITIEQIYVFPGFDLNNSEYEPDVALIKLSSSAQTHSTIEVLTQDQDLGLIETGDWCKVLGWGSTDMNGTQSDIMKEGQMVIIDQTYCSSVYSPGNTLFDADSTICAGYLSGETAVGAGAGDSGGPLFVLKNQQPLLIGVVSGGQEVITTDVYPGIYTKLYKVRDWIANTMNQSAGLTEIVTDHIRIYYDQNSVVMDSKMQLDNATTYTLCDMTGNIIQSGTTQLEIGKTVLPLKNELVDGMYIFTLSGTNFQTTNSIAIFH